MLTNRILGFFFWGFLTMATGYFLVIAFNGTVLRVFEQLPVVLGVR